MVAIGATMGTIGANPTTHKNITPESTYIRNGVGPPGPPPRATRLQHFSRRNLVKKVLIWKKYPAGHVNPYRIIIQFKRSGAIDDGINPATRLTVDQRLIETFVTPALFVCTRVYIYADLRRKEKKNNEIEGKNK